MSIFANAFDLVGLHHERCEKPTCSLSPEQHHELKLPVIGKVHLDVYADYAGQRMFTRLYSMERGEVAWYHTALAESRRSSLAQERTP